jgi:hypothetical protein
MRNEPSADPGTLQPGVGSKLTSSSCSPITSKAEVWQRHKASNSAHIPATDIASALSFLHCHNWSIYKISYEILPLQQLVEGLL